MSRQRFRVPWPLLSLLLVPVALQVRGGPEKPGTPAYHPVPGRERQVQLSVEHRLRAGASDTPGIHQTVKRILNVRLLRREISAAGERVQLRHRIQRVEADQWVDQNSISVQGADRLSGLDLSLNLTPAGPMGTVDLIQSGEKDGAFWSLAQPWLDAIRTGLDLDLPRLPEDDKQLDDRWTTRRTVPLSLADLPGLSIEVIGMAVLRGVVPCASDTLETCWQIDEDLKVDCSQRAGWASKMVEVKAKGAGRAVHRLSVDKGEPFGSRSELDIDIELRSIFDPGPLPLASRSRLKLKVRLAPYREVAR